MKITKRQLRRIIREEKTRLLKESPMPMKSRLDPYVAKMLEVSKMLEAPYGPVGAEEYNVSYQRDKQRETMSSSTASAVQLLQTVYYNLDDLSGGAEPDIAAELEAQMELIKDAIHAMGAVLP